MARIHYSKVSALFKAQGLEAWTIANVQGVKHTLDIRHPKKEKIIAAFHIGRDEHIEDVDVRQAIVRLKNGEETVDMTIPYTNIRRRG